MARVSLIDKNSYFDEIRHQSNDRLENVNQRYLSTKPHSRENQLHARPTADFLQVSGKLYTKLFQTILDFYQFSAQKFTSQFSYGK